MCVFCKIVAQELPCYKIYENDQVLSFLDIRPVHPGHTLVIPKTHVGNLEAIKADDLQALILVVKQVGKMLKEKLNVPGYNVILNNDEVAGQDIAHVHFHVIPRYPHDDLKLFPSSSLSDKILTEVLSKLLN